MEKKKKDVTGAKYIEHERGVGMLKCYFEDLLNEENEHNLEGINMVQGPK